MILDLTKENVSVAVGDNKNVFTTYQKVELLKLEHNKFVNKNQIVFTYFSKYKVSASHIYLNVNNEPFLKGSLKKSFDIIVGDVAQFRCGRLQIRFVK